ncbi:MAG: hypothetical protein Q9M36_14105 [Sulfurovum sp.]|nr:hypothetical protein [Sulfurovum sp.]
MGGYGAVLYGSLINATILTLVGVCSELIGKSCRRTCSRKVELVDSISSAEFNEIIEKSSCQHHILVGETDAIDMLCYSYYEEIEQYTLVYF